MIKVINKHKHISNNTSVDFYIGRGSPLGNPYTSIQDRKTKAEFVCSSREESISCYKEYLTKKISKKDKLICDKLNKIYLTAKSGKDVNLICFCKPKPCHGDIIKELIESKLYDMDNFPEWITNDDRPNYYQMEIAHIHYVDEITFSELVKKNTTRFNGNDGNILLLQQNGESYLFIKQLNQQ